MSDDEKTEPFVLLTGKDATLAPPRPGPTMAQINDRLGKLEYLSDQVLKRIGQMALMVDGFGGNLNRRIDVLHEEAALLRASVTHPANDVIPYSQAKTPAQKARAVVAVPVKLAGYASSLAVGMRLIANQYPEYKESVDSILGVFGL